ncbi:5'/3'-nucleotidase SurE [Jiangella sp. DSM 45060]|uniref:5'/3'-nucleotidase SurE n=1 Tax=Jiangella sp. DSM 45060 TaxID=1798224 RepID=UPI00087B82B3|nr:5'/3'-nucleotidase SurE [Jiangella sp. DSM 45060]SDT72899.1 5'-nucleotidase [Jiangella sp. DSM 45060]
MTGPQRALVTNDDGIDAPGLRTLAAAVRDLGLETVVAAPAVQSSGSSASIIAGLQERDRIALERRTLDGLEDLPAFAVGGAPGLIALIAAYGAFGDPPDVVLSGVNHGANVGRAILHSGTVGAALTAGINGRRGLAVSLDVGLAVEFHLEDPAAEPHWATAADLAARVVPFLLEQRPGTILNLNVPDREPDELAGLRVAPLAEFGIVQTTMTEQTDEHIRLSVADLSEPPGTGTDAALLAEGHPVITAVRSVCEIDVPALDELVDAAVATEAE